MLNGNDNENGFKTNTSNQQKNKSHVQRSFSSNQQKENLHVQHNFLSFPCRCFAPLQRCFVRLKRQTSQLHIIFMEELSYVLTQYFVSCVRVRFYFLVPLISTLLAASISHFLTTAIKFSCFSSGRKEIRLLSFISGSCSFSVIHINVDIEIYSQKKNGFLDAFPF